MKTMKLVTMLFLTMGLMLVSCEKEGPIGPEGPEGAVGPAGEQGVQGEQGYANVQTYTINTSALSGSFFDLPLEALTQDVLDNDVVLQYIQRGNFYYPIPGISENDLFEVELRLGAMFIWAYERQSGDVFNIPAGRYTLVKTVIIESSETTALKATKTEILSELKSQGVDVNDFYQVADYYGLEY